MVQVLVALPLIFKALHGPGSPPLPKLKYPLIPVRPGRQASSRPIMENMPGDHGGICGLQLMPEPFPLPFVRRTPTEMRSLKPLRGTLVDTYGMASTAFALLCNPDLHRFGL